MITTMNGSGLKCRDLLGAAPRLPPLHLYMPLTCVGLVADEVLGEQHDQVVTHGQLHPLPGGR